MATFNFKKSFIKEWEDKVDEIDKEMNTDISDEDDNDEKEGESNEYQQMQIDDDLKDPQVPGPSFVVDPISYTAKLRTEPRLVMPTSPQKLSSMLIINLPIEEFHKIAEGLPAHTQAKLRDIRRRGKNRIAARKSREKKMEQMESLKMLYANKAAESQQLLMDIQHMKNQTEQWQEIVELFNKYLNCDKGTTTTSFTTTPVSSSPKENSAGEVKKDRNLFGVDRILGKTTI